MGEEIDGAMQQAPQPIRHCMGTSLDAPQQLAAVAPL